MKKRIIALLLTALLLLSLVACGGTSGAEADGKEPFTQGGQEQGGKELSTQDGQEQGDNGNEAAPGDANEPDEPTKAPEPAEFQPNEDLTAVTGFIYDNSTYILIENTGNKPILDYVVAYMTFDKNGFPTITDSDGYERGRDDAANLMPGDKTLPSWYGGKGNYVAATVSYVKYADGTEWEAQYLDVWAAETKNSFNMDDYAAAFSSLKEVGAQALSCEYATLTNVKLEHGNRYSNDLDLWFTVTNIGSQGIAEMILFIMEFDEDGFPVSVSPYDTYCLNGHSTGGSINLASGNTGTYTNDLFADGSTAHLKSVIYSLTFQDGSEWFNPYVYEYIIANNSAY